MKLAKYKPIIKEHDLCNHNAIRGGGGGGGVTVGGNWSNCRGNISGTLCSGFQILYIVWMYLWSIYHSLYIHCQLPSMDHLLSFFFHGRDLS